MRPLIFGLQPSPPTAITVHSSAISPIASGSKTPLTVAPDQFQRRVSCNNLLHGTSVLILMQLNLPPRSVSDLSSRLQAPQTKPTPILRPRRPLWIISRHHVKSTVEYKVHWNSGKDSWEPHDSLYRDHPLLIESFLKGRR